MYFSGSPKGLPMKKEEKLQIDNEPAFNEAVDIIANIFVSFLDDMENKKEVTVESFLKIKSNSKENI